MHTFVHVTKTSGTTFEQYFKKYHPKHISGVGHTHTCSNSKNPIIIIRDPVDRFVSMFKYWRNGAESGKYTRDERWNPKCESINDFIGLLERNDQGFKKKFLHRDFTTHLHFAEQTNWLKPSDYKKAIVITYDKHAMDEKMKSLLNYLNIEAKGLPLPKTNVTKHVDSIDTVIDEQHMASLKRMFAADYRLWHMVTCHPSRFKKVF